MPDDKPPLVKKGSRLRKMLLDHAHRVVHEYQPDPPQIYLDKTETEQMGSDAANDIVGNNIVWAPPHFHSSGLKPRPRPASKWFSEHSGKVYESAYSLRRTVLYFIGDVHGKFKQFHRLLDEIVEETTVLCETEDVFPVTIQVGDMGIGFRRSAEKVEAGQNEWSPNPSHDKMDSAGCSFIRGNHDNPEKSREHILCRQDGSQSWFGEGCTNFSAMFVGGGLSVDRMYRTPGYDWWPDEELSDSEFEKIENEYFGIKPDIMVTHDCPERLAMRMMALSGNKYKHSLPSRTRFALDRMLSVHKPMLWVFGHWHTSMDEVIDGTRFICLEELEKKRINLRDLLVVKTKEQEDARDVD